MQLPVAMFEIECQIIIKKNGNCFLGTAKIELLKEIIQCGSLSGANFNIVYPRITYGGNLVYASDSSAFGASLITYLQQGKDPNKALDNGFADLKSFFLATKISYGFLKNLSANIGIDYYSGSDADANAAQSNTFNRLYGAPHNYNGYMEYFVTLPRQGLIDYYGGSTLNINRKFSVDIAGHLFYFEKDFFYNKVKTEKYLGAELNVVLNYVISKEIAIQVGYSRYFNSGSTAKYFNMQNIDAHRQQWAYLMWTVKLHLYKTPPNPDNR